MKAPCGSMLNKTSISFGERIMTSTIYDAFRLSTIAHGNHKSLTSTCPCRFSVPTTNTERR
jgi:hypothetical protein